MATEAQLAKIATLEAAYEKLLMGKSAVIVVDSTGERVEYNRASLDKLEGYIRKLKVEYGLLSPSTMRPLGVIYG